MSMRRISILLLSIITIVSTFSTVEGKTDGWVTVGTGIEYQVYPSLYNGYDIHVTRMVWNKNNPLYNKDVFIDSIMSEQTFTGTARQTVRQMAARYDQAINYWGKTWGGRNRVVVAINGDYFDQETPLPVPEDGMVHSGWYDKRFLDCNGWSGFAFMMDGDAFIGEAVNHIKEKQFITFVKDSSKMLISDLNRSRNKGELIIYTPDYGTRTPKTGDTGIEVVIEMAQPAGIIPNGYMANGIVIAKYSGNGGNPIPFDGIVLSSSDATATTLDNHTEVGDSIGVTQEVTSLQWDNCAEKIDATKDWTNAYGAVGGAYAFLRNGVIYGKTDDGTATNQVARTAVAMNNDYIFFFVVEGRDDNEDKIYKGMSFYQMGQFARDKLQATWAIAQDGGGSSTMVINGQVVNTLSDCEGTDQPQSECERGLVNGLMMVVQDPMVKTTGYDVGEPTIITKSTSLRTGPGTNYGSIASLSMDTPVIIAADSHQLNGVLAKGSFWWKVNTENGLTGWVSSNDLPAHEVMLPIIRR